MEAQEIHRGRLFDHVQLVVRNLAASQAFYTAVLEALQVPMGGADEGYFWADELFVSSADSPAAQGHLTGRHHLAFQARDRAMVDAFYRAALAHGGTDNGAPGERRACSKSFWRSHWSAIGMSGCFGCLHGLVPMQAAGAFNHPISLQPFGQVPCRAVCGVAALADSTGYRLRTAPCIPSRQGTCATPKRLGTGSHHPGYYAAFVLDPDGNNIEAVFHGDAQRSAASVKITF